MFSVGFTVIQNKLGVLGLSNLIFFFFFEFKVHAFLCFQFLFLFSF